MSYQIYYDRAFIRIGSKFIPLVNSGSNNCFEHGPTGRYRCEKYWSVLNWKHRGRFIFTETEIREIARDYDLYNQESGTMHKSRNRVFESGEMERWIIGGMKNAYTIEEYVSFGNSFSVLDYSPDKTKDWTNHPFTRADELQNILDGFVDSESLEINMADNRHVYRPKFFRAPQKKLNTDELSEYYVLRGETGGAAIYFAGFSRKGGFKYYGERQHVFAKPFLTEKDAQQYLKKYSDRLGGKYGFSPMRVSA